MSYRLMAWLGLLAAGAVMTGCGRAAEATSCEGVVGRWSWFIGGEVDVTRDGQFTQQSGNSGTWECSDAGRGEVTFRWHAGGFVNRMVMSADGASLTSVDPTQAFVTARRATVSGAGASTAANATPATAPNPAPPPVAPSPASSAQGAQSAPATAGSEVETLATRINAQYAGSQHSFSTMVFKGQSAVLEPGYVLVLRDLKCDGDRNRNFKDLEFEIASAQRTRLLTQLAADCDARRDGLAWEPTVKRVEFKKMRYPKFEVVKHTDGHLGTHSIRLATLQGGVEGFRPDDVVESIISIACKDQRGCEQMAKDLDALVNAIGVPRGTYQRPAGR